MKNLILIGTLCATMLAPISAHAQEALVAPAPVDPTNGHELLLEAAKSIKFSLKPAELNRQLAPNGRPQRISMKEAYSPLALDKLRVALKAGIVVPPPRFNDGRPMHDFLAYPASMAFSRQLSQEAAMRSADGDAMGAAQSGLDAMQLGAQIGRGVSTNASTGMKISTLGREILEAAAPALDAAQSRDVAAQLDAISEQVPKMTEVFRAEEAYHLKLLNHLRDELSDPAKRATAEAQEEAAAIAAAQQEAARLAAATTGKNLMMGPIIELPAALEEVALVVAANATGKKLTMTGALLEFPAVQIEDAFHQTFDEATALAVSPYVGVGGPAKSGLVKSGIPYVDFTGAMLTALPGRFAFERDIVANRQLAAALRLHAIKLETGQYPATFEAGTDPFSPTFAPMVYKRAGENYILYSVGPDGKDEDGAEIQTLRADYRTSIKSVTSVLRYDSTGDIVAPVL